MQRLKLQAWVSTWLSYNENAALTPFLAGGPVLLGRMSSLAWTQTHSEEIQGVRLAHTGREGQPLSCGYPRICGSNPSLGTRLWSSYSLKATDAIHGRKLSIRVLIAPGGSLR